MGKKMLNSVLDRLTCWTLKKNLEINFYVSRLFYKTKQSRHYIKTYTTS